jgi:hypothetical protein
LSQGEKRGEFNRRLDAADGFEACDESSSAAVTGNSESPLGRVLPTASDSSRAIKGRSRCRCERPLLGRVSTGLFMAGSARCPARTRSCSAWCHRGLKFAYRVLPTTDCSAVEALQFGIYAPSSGFAPPLCSRRMQGLPDPVSIGIFTFNTVRP